MAVGKKTKDKTVRKVKPYSDDSSEEVKVETPAAEVDRTDELQRLQIKTRGSQFWWRPRREAPGPR